MRSTLVHTTQKEFFERLGDSPWKERFESLATALLWGIFVFVILQGLLDFDDVGDILFTPSVLDISTGQ